MRLLRGSTTTSYPDARADRVDRADRRALRGHARCRHAAAARGGGAPGGDDGPSAQSADLRCAGRPGRRTATACFSRGSPQHCRPDTRHRSSSAIFSGSAGIDPYASAVSDVYQDLFGEGSFTGKGIYDVDAFEAALADRVPENALLSHDLFEGVFARAGLVTDIELFENSRRTTWSRRPASTAGRGATGSSCPGSLAGPATRRASDAGSPFPASPAGRWSTTCAGRSRLP